MYRLAPNAEIEQCCWYKNETGESGKTTRGEKVKYAIQKGLPDKFVETFFDTKEYQRLIKEAIEILNKYTHVNSDTFHISEDEIDELTAEVLAAFKEFINGIDDYYFSLKAELETHIDKALFEHIIFETFDEIDILSTHHNIESSTLESFKIIDINSKEIFVDAEGFVEVRHQFGSDADFAKGDGEEIYSTFPFTCDLEIKIDRDFSKSEYLLGKFNIDTDEWYE